jgi:hypothetical protein
VGERARGAAAGDEAGGDRGSGSEWYAGGLRFECTKCGNCCTGPPGAVWFDEAEGRKIAKALRCDEETFYREYAVRLDEGWSLRERATEHGFDCILLDRSKPGEALCSISSATWPFWPENLSTQRAWTTAKRRTPCPGMDRGALVPVERIRILRAT